MSLFYLDIILYYIDIIARQMSVCVQIVYNINCANVPVSLPDHSPKMSSE